MAFLGVLLTAVMISLFVSNVLMKSIVTVISIPGIYLVKEQRVELAAG